MPFLAFPCCQAVPQCLSAFSPVSFLSGVFLGRFSYSCPISSTGEAERFSSNAEKFSSNVEKFSSHAKSFFSHAAFSPLGAITASRHADTAFRALCAMPLLAPPYSSVLLSRMRAHARASPYVVFLPSLPPQNRPTCWISARNLRRQVKAKRKNKSQCLVNQIDEPDFCLHLLRFAVSTPIIAEASESKRWVLPSPEVIDSQAVIFRFCVLPSLAFASFSLKFSKLVDFAEAKQ
ncbi:hypothetical protein EII14_08195 [Alloprevotella sp. OH1205_COT-284]|uniref:hypothetical protein n=1 Tax=Alloprevotella sp. OH1205_COT-284 TaxID=2491043 RepID=UPI000F5E30F2|nr:hypothetical protein [Alloprevotella sp. OH1205_COT-284]RRD75950.1 hypothetical protein EII14_08195 [Alloprevotella sp. OH1205_COT-284]